MPAQPTNAYGSQAQYQQTGPYNRSPVGGGGGNSTMKNIGIGCLLLIAIMMFIGLSCTRACFGRRHTYIHRRY
jgi:hypothetical protein